MTEQYERITNDPKFDGSIRDSHEARYHIARGFMKPEYTVLDAGAGVGYGFEILIEANDNQAYIGLDRNPANKIVYKADFETGEGIDDHTRMPFDIFVGLEIIEHLNDEGVKRFVMLAKEAKRWIVVSTPIVPNSNKFHKQQFNYGTLLQLFLGEGWRHYQTFSQNNTYGIFIFKKKE